LEYRVEARLWVLNPVIDDFEFLQTGLEVVWEETLMKRRIIKTDVRDATPSPPHLCCFKPTRKLLSAHSWK
jgi:hypothetical protein